MHHLHLPQSLLVLIGSRFLTHLHNASIKPGRYSYPKFCSDFSKNLSLFFHKLGYVSQHFLESATITVQVFLESNTHHLDSQELDRLLSLSSFFGANIRSVNLLLEHTFKSNTIFESSSIVSGLQFNLDYYVNDFTFLNHPRSHSFPLLKRLDITVYPGSPFTSFADHLSLNSTIKELDLVIDMFTSSAITALTTIFSSNTTITKLAISNRGFAVSEAEFMSLFTGLSKNSTIKSVDLSHFFTKDSDVVIPLLRSFSLKSILFPRVSQTNSKVFSALVSNTSLQEVSFFDTKIDIDGLSEVLTCNTNLRKLSLSGISTDFSSLFNSLTINSSLVELCLSRTRWRLDENQASLLVEMLKKNTGLLVLTLDSYLFKSISFKNILIAIQTNSILKKVSLPSLNLNCLITLYKAMFTNEITSPINMSPHYLNVTEGILSFNPGYRVQISLDDFSSLQNLVESTNIRRLSLSTCEFGSTMIPILIDFIKTNNHLTFMGFPGCELYGGTLMDIIDALQSNSTLKSVDLSFNCVPLKVLLAAFELVTRQKLLPDIRFDPHVFDVSRGFIRFESRIQESDLTALLTSGIPLKYLKCLGFGFPTIPGLMIVYEILAMRKVDLDLDIFPHFVDVINGVFLFAPVSCKQISRKDTSSLTLFWRVLRFKN
ncbi:hypothetical protein GEMRC1_005154 [Eukaryota sp. GEM-RC1]